MHLLGLLLTSCLLGLGLGQLDQHSLRKLLGALGVGQQEWLASLGLVQPYPGQALWLGQNYGDESGQLGYKQDTCQLQCLKECHARDGHSSSSIYPDLSAYLSNPHLLNYLRKALGLPFLGAHHGLASLLSQATVGLANLDLDSARPLVVNAAATPPVADVATLTNFLRQVGRDVILQNPSPSSPHDPTNNALANFFNQAASSLCPSPPNCATLAAAGATPGPALANYVTSQSLRTNDALANILNEATVAMALSASTPPGAGFADFFNGMAANLNRRNDIAGNTFLANFLTQLAMTLAV